MCISLGLYKGVPSSTGPSRNTEAVTQHAGSGLQLTWQKVAGVSGEDADAMIQKWYFIECKIFTGIISLESTLKTNSIIIRPHFVGYQGVLRYSVQSQFKV